MLLRLYILALLHLLLLLSRLLLTSPAQVLAVVCLVPLPEGGSIDLDDSCLGEGIGTHEFVVGRMEGDADDTDFARDALTAPGEVARVQAQSTELAVATARAYEMDALAADTGVGRLATFLEGSVFTSEFDGRQERSGYAYLFLR